MIGNQEKWQEDIFLACRLSDLIPDDHILKRVDQVLDLSWLEDEVREVYCENNGRPSIDPESALRLMLAGFFEGIVHDRKLMRAAQVNIAIRWFAGYKLHEKLPHHSSLTRIRQRWGAERFKKIFQKTVELCIEKGLVDGETVHVDATLIRANVSWESLTEKHAEEVLAENGEQKEKGGDGDETGSGRPRTKKVKVKKISKTDPEATLTTSSHNQRMEPSYKQHTAVDDKAGVVVDVEVTTGEKSEGKELKNQIERVESVTGKKLGKVTADAGYAHSGNYAMLEERETVGVIPPQKERGKASKIPIRRFKYDGKNEIVKCSNGKLLTKRSRNEKQGGWIFRSKASDCKNCPLREHCLSETARSRTILITDGYEALLRARRWHVRWDEKTKKDYNRHRWLVEGRHGEAKTEHGLRRAVRRGLENVAIQVYLTAAVMNLKRAALFLSYFWGLWKVNRPKISRFKEIYLTKNIFTNFWLKNLGFSYKPISESKP